MKAKNIMSIFLLVLCFSCSNGQKRQTQLVKEDFNEFYKKFYSDSIFQKTRIKFPLPGIDTDKMDINSNDTIYYWKANEWKMLQDISIEEYGLKKEVTKNDSLVTIKVFKENSGFIIETRFSFVDGKWYLINLMMINT